MGRRDVQNRIYNILAKAGITPESLAAHAAEGLRANETKLASWEGRFTDERQVPDHSARYRYFEATSKMLGMFPQEESQPTGQLILVLPSAVLTPGHKEHCNCDTCVENWNKMADAHNVALGDIEQGS
jgi:hypothetical protein